MSLIVFFSNLFRYEWENKVNVDDELLLIIKTQESKLQELHEVTATDSFKRSSVQHVSSIHPYDTPEFISLPVDHASEKYGKWVLNQTRDL